MRGWKWLEMARLVPSQIGMDPEKIELPRIQSEVHILRVCTSGEFETHDGAPLGLADVRGRYSSL